MPVHEIIPENRSMLVDPSDVEMTPPVFIKTPAERLSYTWDWTSWLLDADQIVESSVALADGLVDEGDTALDTRVIQVISGGVAGVSYLVTNRITTTLGLIAERTITINVRTTR